MSFIKNPSKDIKIEVENLKTSFMVSATFLKLQHTELFNMVWGNPDFTPEQIVEALGKEAAAFFKLSSDTQKLLKEIDPTYIELVAPKKFTLNVDGTVTLK